MGDQPRIDLEELRAALTGRLEALAENLLGDRNKDFGKRGQWRFGSRGSLSLEISGRKRGAWHSHEAGEGGGPIDLIRFVRGIPLEDAVTWGALFAGISAKTRDDPAEQKRQAAERERKRRTDEADEATDQARRIATAQGVWGKTTPIADTVAERYLIETRGIPAAPWPDAVRFLPARTVTLPGTDETLRTAGAIVMAATAPDGPVQAIQRVS